MKTLNIFLALLVIFYFAEFSSGYSQHTKFYGISPNGGIDNSGFIFSTDGKGDGLAIVHRFDISDTAGGYQPTGRLLQCANGMLYGTTRFGGVYKNGILFTIDPATDNFRKIADFDGIVTGRFPTGYLVEASNGKIYGFTSSGGYDSLHPPFTPGKLFEFDPNTEILSVKVDFNGREKGNEPVGGLVQAEDGKLYGMTFAGGITEDEFHLGYGVLFNWDPVTNIFTKLKDFNALNSEAFAPGGSLVYASNHKLYGVTHIGGNYVDQNNFGYGVLFEWDPETNLYENKFVFSKSECGYDPDPNIMQADNGKLYGSTLRGGIYTHHEPVGEVSNGVIFEWNPNTGEYRRKVNFEFTETGHSVSGPFVQAKNGKLYGSTTNGGLYGAGVFFELDPITNVFVKKFDIQSSYTTSAKLTSEKAEAEISNIGGGLLEVTYSFKNYTKVEACDTYYHSGRNDSLSESGLYIDTLQSSSGWDSIVTVDLTIHKSTLSSVDVTVCETFRSETGKIYNESGIYSDTIQNKCGCDSVIMVNLNINHSSTSTIDTTANDSYLSPSGKLWTTTGSYSDTIPNIMGCDSVISVHLTIEETTGIEARNTGEVRLFPNPSNGSFIIDVGKEYPEITLVITDINGRIIRSYNYENTRSVNVSTSLSAGVYTGVLRFRNHYYVVKILIE